MNLSLILHTFSSFIFSDQLSYAFLPFLGFPQILLSCPSPLPYVLHILTVRARGGTVGGGTTLQAERFRFRFPVVSLKFLIDIVPPVALRHGALRSFDNIATFMCRLSLNLWPPGTFRVRTWISLPFFHFHGGYKLSPVPVKRRQKHLSH